MHDIARALDNIFYILLFINLALWGIFLKIGKNGN